MEYRQVVAVTGLSGLYQLMSTKTDGAIVRSLVDNSNKFISARVHHITPLESIEIYSTSEQNARLHEVFETIMKDDADVLALNKKKDDAAARQLFGKILPEFDTERVYTSDIKKVYKWYEILKNADLLKFDYLKAEPIEVNASLQKAEVAASEEIVAEVAEKPKKKATKKAEVEGEEAEKPKKAAAKKIAKKKEEE